MSTITSLSGAEAAKQAVIQAAEEKAREEKLLIESDRLDKDALYLQKYIHNNANPSPVMIAVCIVAIILVLWLIIGVGLRPNATGEWYDSSGHQWLIDHSCWSGRASAFVNNERSINIDIVDNMVKIGPKIGVWNYRDTIIFVGGGKLERVAG